MVLFAVFVRVVRVVMFSSAAETWRWIRAFGVAVMTLVSFYYSSSTTTKTRVWIRSEFSIAPAKLFFSLWAGMAPSSLVPRTVSSFASRI